MHEPAGVPALDIAGHLSVIFSVKRLVPERKHHDGGAVFIAFIHPLDPVHEGVAPFRIIGKHQALIFSVFPAAKRRAMGFEIGFVYYIKAKLVAHPQERRCVGIMRGPNAVDIVPLHQQQFF